MMVLAFYVALCRRLPDRADLVRSRRERHDLTSLKTVTFGDESAIVPDRAASVISVVSVFLIWGAFTGSAWAPFHVPGPFTGETAFTYTAQNAAGQTDTATVRVIVHAADAPAPDLPDMGGGDGFRPRRFRRGGGLAVGADPPGRQ
jgi:taurine transport system permease protein